MSHRIRLFKQELSRLHCVDGKVLLAVSGGRDSMVLAELCRISNMEIVIAHFNHGLRGVESEGDEVLVHDYARTHDIRFISQNWEIDKSVMEGSSLQDIAHEARMSWLKGLLTDHALDFLFVAHHADDAL